MLPAQSDRRGYRRSRCENAPFRHGRSFDEFPQVDPHRSDMPQYIPDLRRPRSVRSMFYETSASSPGLARAQPKQSYLCYTVQTQRMPYTLHTAVSDVYARIERSRRSHLRLHSAPKPPSS